MELIFIASCVLAVIYIGTISRIWTYWEDTPVFEPSKKHDYQKTLQIILPVRNEARHISTTIQRIMDAIKVLPPDVQSMITFTCINDHSTDNTSIILDRIKDPSITIIDAPENVIGKKACIRHVVKLSNADYILCTDGDCIVPVDWVRTMWQYIEKSKYDMVTGPVATVIKDTLLAKWQYLDIIGMMGVTAYGIRSKRFRLANGANMIFERLAFEQYNVYDNNAALASGDDVFLIQAIYRNQGRVAFLKSVNAIVRTHTEPTWRELWQQRKRWATKTKSYREKGVIKLQSFVGLYIVIAILSILLAPLTHGLSLFTGIFMIFVKMTMDYLLLSQLADFFAHRKALKWYLIIGISHLFYIIIAGWNALVPTSYDWKERRSR